MKNTRIMYIEFKGDGATGPARIGRVTFSKSGQSIYYRGKTFIKTTNAMKANYLEVETGMSYWISGPRKDGLDALYLSNVGAEIDEDVREEYWTVIRNRPDLIDRRVTQPS